MLIKLIHYYLDYEKIFLIVFAILQLSLFSHRITQAEMDIHKVLTPKDYSNEVMKELFTLSMELDYNKRIYIYDSYKLPITTPTILNGILGFGIGSYSQNDKVWGTAFAITDTVASGGVLGSFLVLSAYLLWLPIDLLSGNNNYESFAWAESLLKISLGTLGVSRIAQIIRPIYRGYSVNSKLWDSLHLDINFTPKVKPSDKVTLGISAILKI